MKQRHKNKLQGAPPAPMKGEPPAMYRAREALSIYFGYSSFRPAQEKVVMSLLEGHDTVAIMPTGAGKSICFQIPALLLPGITVVVSPLISLMKDQVGALTASGVPAAFLSSTQTQEESRAVLSTIAKGGVKLVYTSPERLESDWFKSFLKERGISLIAVDEAHCLSQWGHDFRPSYRNIISFISSLEDRPIIGAFTATATPDVKDDIISLLNLGSPNVFVTGFDRPNLFFDVLRGEDKKAFIISYLRHHPKDPGIIYCATRKDVNTICTMLKKKRFRAGRYHAGLTPEERQKTQDDFLFDRLQVIAATNAFGMGIDKSNVRFVIHYNMPKNIESYYQEAGRAGRDGEPGECILLYSGQDVLTQKYLIDISTDDPDRKALEMRRLNQMDAYCHTTECLRAFIIRYFGGIVESDNCGSCGNCKGEFDEIDITIDTQKILSCIYRMHQKFGIGITVNVLRGSTDERIMSLGFDKLSTFGIMKESSVKDIRQMVQRLIALGFIGMTNGRYPTLYLTASSADVLKGKCHVMQHVPKEKEPKKKNSFLFEALRNLRTRIAQRDDIPPYIIFSDATLRDMCAVLPENKEEMLTVSGVGEKKYELYGRDFIACIDEYRGREVREDP